MAAWAKFLDFIKGEDHKFLNNEPWRYLALIVCLFAGMVVGRIIRHILVRTNYRLKKGGHEVLGAFVECLAAPASLLCSVIGLQIGFAFLEANMSDGVAAMETMAMGTLFAVIIGYAMYRLVDIVDLHMTRWANKTATKFDDMLVPLVRKSLRVTVVVITAMFTIECVYGKPVSTLLAGLGIGGLAIALAAQESIKNFFGSLMILTDKPFQVGERIVIGAHDGPVEAVGFRSTKIRTLQGHLVSVPNGVVANEMILNISRRPHIRRQANITITYDTPPEKVTRAIEIVREILKDHEGMQPEFPPRVYFTDFKDSALNIMMMYWYHPPSYWDFVAFNEKVNLQILERFNAEGIDFAFPTQTVYLANDAKRQLALKLLREDPASATN